MKRAIAAAMLASIMLAGVKASAQPASDAASAETARSMEAAYIAVPVVRQGILVNYLFVTLRVDIAPGVDLWRTREKAHFLRDALVRVAHSTSLADPSRDDQLNTQLAQATFRRAAEQTLGANAVRDLTILSAFSSRRSTASQR